MTYKEKDLILKSILEILSGYRESSQDIIDYLETDIYMQIKDDLEAIRQKRFPLPMSGVKDE